MTLKPLQVSTLIFLLTALVTLQTCLAEDQKDHSTEPSAAVFDWFEYKGNDPEFESPLGDDQYRNPILAGFYPDPSVVRVGDDFYMVNSTFGYFPGIPIFHSRDLINWTQIGNVIDRESMMSFEGIHLSQQGLYAPTIEYQDGLYYVANTCVACDGNFVVTAKNPAGPWSNPVWLPDVGGIDPSLFFEDGRVFIVNHNHPAGPELYDGHRAIWIREVDPVTLQSISERKMLVDGGVKIDEKPIYVEGPHLYKVDGRYYLSAAEGGTGMDHRQVIFRSDDIWGPYAPYENNPILTQRKLSADRPNPITSTGHADLFSDANGNWWAVFLGTRTYDTIDFNTGRETFMLPFKWRDGWPVILQPGKVVPYQVKRPDLPVAAELERPVTGNFTIREEFESVLPNYWIFVRMPTEQWWTSGSGQLGIQPRTDRIGDTGQPSLVARRIQHMNMTATTAMRFTPHAADSEAGLAAIQNDAYYFTFGISLNHQDQNVLRLRQRAGQNEPEHGRVLKEHHLEIDSGDTLYLRIEVRGPKADFSWSLDGEKFNSFKAGVDASILSTMRAGGFVGATVGMYAEKGN